MFGQRLFNPVQKFLSCYQSLFCVCSRPPPSKAVDFPSTDNFRNSSIDSIWITPVGIHVTFFTTHARTHHCCPSHGYHHVQLLIKKRNNAANATAIYIHLSFLPTYACLLSPPHLVSQARSLMLKKYSHGSRGELKRVLKL